MSEKEQKQLNIDPRILFAGSGMRVIENLMEHIPRQFEMQKCSAQDDLFGVSLRKFVPHVVVICLQNETRKTLKSYSVLDESNYSNLPVIVVGHPDDCELFQKNLVTKEVVVLGRPLNMELFTMTLNEMASESISAEQIKEEEEAVEAEKEKVASLMGERKSILVVDDDTVMLNMIKFYLQEMYDVTVVPTGKLALKFLAKKHADLVLLDYLMPEMSGSEVLEEIRTNSPNKEVPILFLTGVADKDMILKILEHKPKGYLLKPVTRKTLLERVTEILLDL